MSFRHEALAALIDTHFAPDVPRRWCVALSAGLDSTVLLHAMSKVIAELEPHPRQIYCGSVLYISADGRMDSNIAIRTLLCQQGQIHCWGGGGIVADSQWQQEYQEVYDKVGKFLATLESMGSQA